MYIIPAKQAEISAAFNHCVQSYPLAPSLWETHTIEGVPAVLLPDCKAVIWRHALSDELIRVCESLTEEQLSQLHWNFSQHQREWNPADAPDLLAASGIFNTESDARLLGDEIALVSTPLNPFLCGVKKTYGNMHGWVADVPYYHVDTLNAIRISQIFKGRGMRFITSDVSEEHYDMMKSYLPCHTLESTYSYEDLNVGDVIYMKHANFEGLETQSQVHCSITDPEEAKKRLYYGADLV